MVTFRACFTLSKNLLKHRKLEAYSPVRLLSNFVEKKVDVKGENVNVVVSGKVEDGSQAAVLLMPGALVSKSHHRQSSTESSYGTFLKFFFFYSAGQCLDRLQASDREPPRTAAKLLNYCLGSTRLR